MGLIHTTSITQTKGVVGDVLRKTSHLTVFKSQGGLDFELNYIYLNSEDHRGKYGPHLCKATDDEYKLELQSNLEAILDQQHYKVDEVIQILNLDERQAIKAFKKLRQYKNGKSTEDIIRRLMGDWTLKEPKIKW